MDDFGDPTTQPFWAAARQHRLLLQRCGGCGRHQFYPRPFCLDCGSHALAWVEATGKGTVYSQSQVLTPPAPGIAVPYTVALVELAEGPRFMTNLVNGETAIGDPVRVVWQKRDGSPPLPLFEPDRE